MEGCIREVLGDRGTPLDLWVYYPSKDTWSWDGFLKLGKKKKRSEFNQETETITLI